MLERVINWSIITNIVGKNVCGEVKMIVYI